MNAREENGIIVILFIQTRDSHVVVGREMGLESENVYFIYNSAFCQPHNLGEDLYLP